MTRWSRSRMYQIVFFCISVLFLLDAVFLHNLIPWNSSQADTGTTSRVNAGIAHDVHISMPSIPRDIRSRSNFDGNFHDKNSIDTHESTIPKIIHQTWDTEHIPQIFHKWMVTWHKHNPDWKYWFWTLDEVRQFVTKEYPYFLKIYDLYTADIFRSDVLRYLILYKYGGMYMDLDMEALKPLDNWTYGFNCIVSEETYEHPFVVREADPPGNIVNGFIASRPGHPFIKLAIDSLEEFSGYYFGDYMHATGPFFFNAVLDRYLLELVNGNKLNNSVNDVTIIPPKYFFPTYDPSESDIISNRCFPGRYELLKEPAQITCKELLKTFLRRIPVEESYTDHHWVHAYMFNAEWKKKDTKHIHEIIPNAVLRHVWTYILMR